MSLYLACECLITWLTINERARWEFPQWLLLTLTPDSYLHTPEKLQIGQLLGFRLGPAQREKRDGSRAQWVTLEMIGHSLTRLKFSPSCFHISRQVSRSDSIQPQHTCGDGLTLKR